MHMIGACSIRSDLDAFRLGLRPVDRPVCFCRRRNDTSLSTSHIRPSLPHDTAEATLWVRTVWRPDFCNGSFADFAASAWDVRLTLTSGHSSELTSRSDSGQEQMLRRRVRHRDLVLQLTRFSSWRLGSAPQTACPTCRARAGRSAAGLPAPPSAEAVVRRARWHRPGRRGGRQGSSAIRRGSRRARVRQVPASFRCRHSIPF